MLKMLKIVHNFFSFGKIQKRWNVFGKVLYYRVKIVFLVFIRNRWIRTGSHQYEKTMPGIVLYTVFYEYKNVQS